MLSLDDEIVKDIDQNPYITTFSSWVEDMYRQTFMSEDTLDKRMKEIEKEKEKIEEQKKRLEERKVDILDHIKPQEINYIKEVILPIIQRRGIDSHFFEPNFRKFIRKYNRNDINRQMFRYILDRLSENRDS